MQTEMQYTIRNITPEIDKALRDKAKEESQSLNQAALEALENGLDLKSQPKVHHDLDEFAGTWVSDPECEKVLDEMREQIDWEMWK
jgi:tRNA pseudouridine-54 N-methylase